MANTDQYQLGLNSLLYFVEPSTFQMTPKDTFPQIITEFRSDQRMIAQMGSDEVCFDKKVDTSQDK